MLSVAAVTRPPFIPTNPAHDRRWRVVPADYAPHSPRGRHAFLSFRHLHHGASCGCSALPDQPTQPVIHPVVHTRMRPFGSSCSRIVPQDFSERMYGSPRRNIPGVANGDAGGVLFRVVLLLCVVLSVGSFHRRKQTRTCSTHHLGGGKTRSRGPRVLCIHFVFRARLDTQRNRMDHPPGGPREYLIHHYVHVVHLERHLLLLHLVRRPGSSALATGILALIPTIAVAVLFMLGLVALQAPVITAQCGFPSQALSMPG